MPSPATELLSSSMLQIMTKTTTFKRYKMELKWICDKENTFLKKEHSVKTAVKNRYENKKKLW